MDEYKSANEEDKSANEEDKSASDEDKKVSCDEEEAIIETSDIKEDEIQSELVDMHEPVPLESVEIPFVKTEKLEIEPME